MEKFEIGKHYPAMPGIMKADGVTVEQVAEAAGFTVAGFAEEVEKYGLEVRHVKSIRDKVFPGRTIDELMEGIERQEQEKEQDTKDSSRLPIEESPLYSAAYDALSILHVSARCMELGVMQGEIHQDMPSYIMRTLDIAAETLEESLFG